VVAFCNTNPPLVNSTTGFVANWLLILKISNEKVPFNYIYDLSVDY
jgi:hypothetical protein